MTKNELKYYFLFVIIALVIDKFGNLLFFNTCITSLILVLFVSRSKK